MIGAPGNPGSAAGRNAAETLQAAGIRTPGQIASVPVILPAPVSQALTRAIRDAQAQHRRRQLEELKRLKAAAERRPEEP